MIRLILAPNKEYFLRNLPFKSKAFNMDNEFLMIIKKLKGDITIKILDMAGNGHNEFISGYLPSDPIRLKGKLNSLKSKDGCIIDFDIILLG